MSESPKHYRCRVCGEQAECVGTKYSTLAARAFDLCHCANCRYSFIGNPWTDYAAIYNDAYYRGQGADPYVDYETELADPERSIRNHEWDGILAAVRSLVPVSAETKWLDFGCGNGGLVRHVQKHAGAQIVGFDTGSIVDTARTQGIPILTEGELASETGKYDIVTAVEVLEHIENPLGAMKEIRRLLKPGGLFFYTTGNARPFRSNLMKWAYVMPEIHISFYEPSTLERLLTEAGFRAEFREGLAGLDGITRFKAEKRLGFKRTGGLQNFLPWFIFTPLLKWRMGIGRHPIGWAC